MKVFNTTAVCIPSKHYMVDLSERVKEIKNDSYVVISTSFGGIGDAGFEDEAAFVKEFCRLLRREFRREPRIPQNVSDDFDYLLNNADPNTKLGDLFDIFLEWCDETSSPIVLMIDEIDSATNNQVFLDFLAQLRDNYINRDSKGINAFQSVILAGVTDVKHMKSRIRSEKDRKENSPWNIAADFTIDMSLSETGIRGMLDEYEADHHTRMDTAAIAKSSETIQMVIPFL